MNITREMRKRVTPFFEEYMNVKEEGYLDGAINGVVIKQSIRILIDTGIYTPIELSKDILVICNALIPINYIESLIKG